jgi:hypothetical protein
LKQRLNEARLDEQRTRRFTQSGTGPIQIGDTSLHARWRLSGLQEYSVGSGTATDGRQIEMTLAIYFDQLPDEAAVVEALLAQISADESQPLTVDLGRTVLPPLYYRSTQSNQSGAAIGIELSQELPGAPARRTE